MADEVDISSELQNVQLENSVQAIVNKAHPNRPSNQFCEDCEEQIPEQRRIAVQGCRRCAACQEDYELKKRTTGIGGRH